MIAQDSVRLFLVDTDQPDHFLHFSMETQEWISTSTLTPQPVREMAQGLPFLKGGKIQVGIYLDAHLNSLGGIHLTGLKLGFELFDDILQYILNFPLLEFLKQPIVFSHLVEVVDGKVDLDAVQGIDFTESDELRLHWLLDGSVIPAALVNGQITAQTSFSGFANLLFKYPVTAQKLSGTRLTQMETIPTAAVSVDSLEEVQRWDAGDVLEMGETTDIKCSIRTFDAVVEVIVVDRDSERTHAIARQIESRIIATGFLEVPGIGDLVGMTIASGLSTGTPTKLGDLEVGDLSAVAFKIRLKNLMVGLHNVELNVVEWGDATPTSIG